MQAILRTIVLALMLISFASPAFALSSVTIKNATPSDIQSYLIKNASSLGENANIENMTDKSITFVFTRTNFGGLSWMLIKDATLKQTFTFTPTDSGTMVTFNTVGESHMTNGETVVTPISGPMELRMLESIKFEFDGGYLYGFTLGKEKEDGGYPLVEVTPDSPAYNAGLRFGNIVTKVNGNKLKYKDGDHNFITTIQRPEQLVLTVKTGKVEKDYVITSQFFDIHTKQFVSQQKIKG